MALDRARHLGLDVGSSGERPGSPPNEEEEDEEMDLDAVIAAAEAEAQGLSGQGGESSASKGKGREEPVDAGYDIPPEFEDDEEDWAALDGM
jgi:hypothetical protein